MLIPKVTIRQLFLGMTILGLYSMILSWAAQGSVIGYSLSVSIALLILPFAAFAVAYWVLFGLSGMVDWYWVWRTERTRSADQAESDRA